MERSAFCGSRRARNRSLHSAAVLLFLTLLTIVLWRFPPAQYAFYPQCPIYAAFGIQCPGCGATRAIAALLHGHLAEALRWNPLLVCAPPAFALYAAYRSALGLPVAPLSVSPRSLSAAFGVTLLFTIIRNI